MRRPRGLTCGRSATSTSRSATGRDRRRHRPQRVGQDDACCGCSSGVSAARPPASSAMVGRIAPLIGVGVGFHPEMTGRENVLVNARMLGLSAAEVRARFDEIVAFSRDRQSFLDTPVKYYSRHVPAARLRRRDPHRPAGAAGRRGAGGRRPSVPAQVPRPDAEVQQRARRSCWSRTPTKRSGCSAPAPS